MPNLNRRHLLAAAVAACAPGTAAASKTVPDDDAQVARILKRIKPPIFPKRDFDIRACGADPADQTKTTKAVADAIAACNAAGGGRVVVPAGTWPVGAIVLKSHVNLHLDKDATLLFSTDPNDYPLVLTRFEGVECMNYSPFIYAYGQENIAITGEGTLDGQADATHWWDWTKQARDPEYGNAVDALGKMAADGIPVEKRVIGAKGRLRPNFVQPYRCRNILLEGFRIVRSPMWELHPVLSRNITVRGVRIDSTGPNNDGCDPESCRDVLIEKVIFNTGDDCIAIKSGRNQDGRRIGVPSENIVIRDCQMAGGHGGVSLGSEASGGIRNIYVHDCHMGSPNLNRALRLKSNSYRGGYITDVVFRDVTIDEVADDILQVTLDYGEGNGGPYKPQMGRVRMDNVSCRKARRSFDIAGYPDNVIDTIDLRNCIFDNVADPAFITSARVEAHNVRINEKPWQPVMATPEAITSHHAGADTGPRESLLRT
ncbi:MAG: glycoside hydrolase family 28 protein [Asticcacaulis sp.]